MASPASSRSSTTARSRCSASTPRRGISSTSPETTWSGEPAVSKRGSSSLLADLRPDDMVTWHRSEDHSAPAGSDDEIAEAALAGWLQSDGFVGQYEGTNRSLTIEAMTVTEAERQWVLGALDLVFPEVHRHERTVETADGTLDCRRLRLYGHVLSDFVERWQLRSRGVADDRSRPSAHRSSPGRHGLLAQHLPGRGVRVAQGSGERASAWT